MLGLALGMALAAEPTVPQVWAGHQRTVGVRKVPILGEIRTVTDVYMLSKVADRGSEIVLVETPCQIRIQSGAGVKLDFDPAAVPNIPATIIRFTDSGAGLVADWTGGWGTEDVDKDGSPGFRVGVRAPVCSGSLVVGSNTSTTATAQRALGGLNGTVTSVIHRRILGASNACLGLVSKEQHETVTGVFAYVPASDAVTCETATFPDL